MMVSCCDLNVGDIICDNPIGRDLNTISVYRVVIKTEDIMALELINNVESEFYCNDDGLYRFIVMPELDFWLVSQSPMNPIKKIKQLNFNE
jgi:hypothetical protein